MASRARPSEDQAQLVAGLDAVARKLGGLTKTWRFDRMATVCHPASGKVTASFAAVAKHYGDSMRMLSELGPMQTARRLLHSQAVSEGFTALWERRRLDLTVEYLILQRDFRDLFTEEERDIA